MSTIVGNKLANLAKTKEVNVEDLVELKAKNYGPLASNPTTRPGGAALTIGDSYFNTTSQSKVVYTSSGWLKELNLSDVVDALTSTAVDKALSAKQGKTLSDAIAGVISNTYTKTEANSMAMPIGLTYPWTLSEASIPGGAIPRNGQLLSRAVWPQLWALVSSQVVADAVWLAAPYTSRGQYSSGDGSTTFRMPDDNAKHADGNTIAAVTYRGYGKNSAGTVGTHQADQMQGFAIPSVSSVTPVDVAAGASPNRYSMSPQNRTPVSDGTNGTPRLGTETRMTNSTVIWVTVGANGTTNTGSVDVTALATQVSLQSSQIALITAKLDGVDTGFLTFPASTLSTITYTLPSKPTSFEFTIKATAANNGFAIGDEVVIPHGIDNIGTATVYGTQVQEATATGLKLWIGTGLSAYALNKTTGAPFTPLTTQWQLRIRAKIRG